MIDKTTGKNFFKKDAEVTKAGKVFSAGLMLLILSL